MGTPTTTRPCPSMPSPASELDLGPFDDVCIREVITRLSIVVGGSLHAAVTTAVEDNIFGPDDTPHTAIQKGELLVRIDAATKALDALLSTFDEAFPAPAQVEEGF